MRVSKHEEREIHCRETGGVLCEEGGGEGRDEGGWHASHANANTKACLSTHLVVVSRIIEIAVL